METELGPKKIFISYTHDSVAHSQRVLALANTLRDEGFDADLDQYYSNQNWPAWMEGKIEWADKVLVICTEIYLKRWDGREVAGVGLGAKFESLLTRQDLYEAEGMNKKFIPCCFASDDLIYIPKPLRPYTRVVLKGVDAIANLKRVIEDIPPAKKPPVRPSLAPIPLADDFFVSESSADAADEELGVTNENEELFSNLLPVEFPESIRTARLPLKKMVGRKDFEASVRRHSTDSFRPTYFIDGNLLYTFDSFDETVWKAIFKEKVITPDRVIATSKLAQSLIAEEKNRFIKILTNSLSEVCRARDLKWSKEMKCHFFPAAPKTKERYVAAKAISKIAKRRIYKAIPSKTNPEETQHWQHQAFRSRFHCFGGRWFLAVTPFWAFTADGTQKPSRFQKKSSANMRKPERNRAVLGHVLFWSSILSQDLGLFSRRGCIKIGECLTASSDKGISDEAWAKYLTKEEAVAVAYSSAEGDLILE